MTLLQNTAEGQPTGTVLTIANSGDGSGDAFSANTGTTTFQDVPAPRGNGSLRCYRADAATSYPSHTLASTHFAAARGYYYLTGNPTTAGLILVLIGGGNGTRLGINTGGRLLVQTAGGSTFTAPAEGTIPLNQWVRVEVTAFSGNGSTNSGRQHVELYAGDASSPFYVYDVSGVNSSNGSPFTGARYGRISGAFPGLYYDDVAVQDSESFIGPTPSGATGSGTLSGSGTLTAGGQPGGAGLGQLAGEGTLSLAGGPAATGGSAALSGSGTLAAAGAPGTRGTAALSGSGTLAATSSSGGSGQAALSGSGMLTAAGAPATTRTAALSGSGTLTAAGRPTAGGAAAFSGSGTLTASGTGEQVPDEPPTHLPGIATVAPHLGDVVLATDGRGTVQLADDGLSRIVLAGDGRGDVTVHTT